MLENIWASNYLKGIFGTTDEGFDKLEESISASDIQKIDNPIIELSFLRQGNSAVRGFNLAVALLAMCDKEAPVTLVAELIEAVEEFKQTLSNAEESLPEAKIAAEAEPDNGERLAKLGFLLNALDKHRDALTAFTQALEYPDTLSIELHRDCLNNIGWAHYLLGEYEEALAWFEHACYLKGPADDDENKSSQPYPLALENILLALSKLGRLTDATSRLTEYLERFGRLPRYESAQLETLGLQPDIVYIRSCTQVIA